MASKREGVAAAIVTALEVASVTGTTKPTALAVHRMRSRPIQADALPAMVVYYAAENVDYNASRKADRSLRFAVECRAKVPDGSSPDTVLDPLLVWIVKALELDVTLGGKTIDLRELSTSWNLEVEADDLAAAAILFEAEYQTAYNDPETV